MDQNLNLKRLSKQEAQEFLVKFGVQKDSQFSEEYFLDVYRDREKLVIITASGHGIEFPDEERFMAYYKPFVEDLKALQKRTFKEQKKTFLLPRQAQEILRQHGWSEVEQKTIYDKSKQVFRNLDGRLIIFHDNKSATIFVSDNSRFETIPLLEETSHNNYDDNVIVIDEDQDINDFSDFEYATQYSLTPSLLPIKIIRNIDEWLLNKIKYYQSLGFFENLPVGEDIDEFSKFRNEFMNHLDRLSDYDLTEFCSWFYRYDDKGNIVPDTPPNDRMELDLLRWDKYRAWHTDEYFDCLNPSLKYTSCIQRLGEISKRVFLPRSIVEIKKDNLIELQLFLDGKCHSIFADARLRRFDQEVIGQVNYLIKDTNHFFEVEGLSSSHNPYEKMLVVILNKEEQKRLSREKGFFRAWQH